MSEQTEQTRKWWASALLVGGVIGLLCLPLAALGTKVGLWSYAMGIPMMGVGAVLATMVFFLGIVAYVVCISRGFQLERSSIIIGVALSVVVLAISLAQFNAARSVPPIHNISTDTENPPQFDKIVAVREAQGAENPLEYDAEKLAQTQRQAYPQVQPLVSAVGPAQMLDNVVSVLEGMGMEIVDVNPSAGRVEATDTTFWFGFEDDVVVRVRIEGRGSVVDVRSVSRVGMSDLGKNAARIAEILGGLQSM